MLILKTLKLHNGTTSSKRMEEIRMVALQINFVHDLILFFQVIISLVAAGSVKRTE